MKIKKILGGLKSKFRNDVNSILEVKIAGKTLKYIKGTVNKKVDQDDAWLYHLTAQVSSFYDIGANTGYITMLALIHGEKEVLMVDPNPLALAKATQNLILNNVGRTVHFWPAFVSDKKGERVKFYTVGAGEAGSMFKSHAQTAAALNSYFYVDSISIDYLYQYYNNAPELIKIDVEGAELLVLEGSTKLASLQKTMFFVEMHAHEDCTMLEAGNAVLEWCEKNRFKPFYLKTHELLKKAETIADRGKCHLLLLPHTMKYPSGLSEIGQRAPLPES